MIYRLMGIGVALLIGATGLFADTIPGGDVSGNWYKSHSPYYITGNIAVPAGDTLSIEPGVDVIFLGYYRFYINGRLNAVGTAPDSIRFVPQDTVIGWRGLYFALRGPQYMSYCDIEYARESGIQMQAVLVSLHISHSTIAHCRSDYGGGIRVEEIFDTLDISHSVIAYNTAETDSGGKGGGIYLYMGTLKMDSCTVHANRAVIPGEDYYHAVQGGGIYIGYNSSGGTVSGSSIADNFIGLSNGGESQGIYPPDRGGGIFNGATGGPVVISHCVISGNRANVDYRSGGGIGGETNSFLTRLSYCDISNNWTPVYAGGLETEGNAEIVNCTFSGNHSYAIISGLGGRSVNVLNTVVAHNRCGIHHSGTACTLRVRCSDIIDASYGMPPGFGVLDRVNRNRDSCDRYYNILLNPMFVDTANHNYHLLANSPCIDAGDSTSPKDPDSTLADMGCYYFDQSSGVEEVQSLRLAPYASRLTVSPNPFTSFATVPGHSSERFSLYDISGRKVGIYKGDKVGWNVSPGVYFIRPDPRNPHSDPRILRVVKVR